MQLVQECGGWCIEGPGTERARVAYACLDNDRITYDLAFHANGRANTRVKPCSSIA